MDRDPRVLEQFRENGENAETSQRFGVDESFEGLISVLADAPLGVHFVDPEGKILWANQTELKLLGYSFDEYVGQDIRRFHADEDKIEEILSILSEGGELKGYEAPLRHKDGGIIHASIHSNVHFVDGRFIHTRCFTRDITERKRSEAELARIFADADANKRLYESLLSTVPDFVYAFDRKARLRFANKTLLDYWDLPLEQVIGKTFRDLQYPDEIAQKIEDQVEQVFTTREGLSDMTYYTDPEGVEGIYEYIFRPMFDKSGNVEMVVGTTREISEHRKISSDLQEAQELFRLAMVSSKMGAWSRNIAEDKVYWTPELEAIFGLEPGTFAGDEGAFFDLILEEDRAAIGKEIEEALAQHREYSILFRFKHADGSIRWMEGRGQGYYSDKGEPERLFGIGIDVTERKAHESFIEERDRWLHEMADSFPQLAWIANPDGYIHWYNRRWYEYTGTTLEQMEGWGWQSVHDQEILSDVLKKWSQSIKNGVEFEMEFPLRRHDGKFEWFLTRAIPFRDAAGNLIRWFGTNTNVEEMRNIRLRSEEANRAKDEFLAMLSHELRAPLNLMAGWSQILKASDYDEATVRKAIDVIFRNVELQTALIEDLLDVSGIVSGKIELASDSVAFDSVVAEAVEMAGMDAKKKDIEIRLAVNCPPAFVVGDEHRLGQIVSNLLSNAIKFTPEGGHIGVDLSIEGGFVRLSVKDDGIGISDDMLPVIFERFRQVDNKSTRSFGGLGLGLSIVESLVNLHGGRVSAKSKGLKQGSEFIVELPVASVQTPSAGSNGQAALAQGPFSLEGIKVLLVDDDPDSLELMAMFLELEGVAIMRSSSVAEALDKIRSNEFDLVISDLGMPEMDGYDLIRELRSEFPAEKLPAIALTGFVSDRDRLNVTEAGFQAHLPKPIEFEDLLSTVRDLLTKKTPAAVN